MLGFKQKACVHFGHHISWIAGEAFRQLAHTLQGLVAAGLTNVPSGHSLTVPARMMKSKAAHLVFVAKSRPRSIFRQFAVAEIQ